MDLQLLGLSVAAHVLVGHRVETTRGADEVMLIRGHSSMSQHRWQIAQHDILGILRPIEFRIVDRIPSRVVVGFRMEEPCVLTHLAV